MKTFGHKKGEPALILANQCDDFSPKIRLHDTIDFTLDCKEGFIGVIPFIDYSKCTGCGACAELYPSFFIMRDEKAWVVNHDKFSSGDHKNIIYCCPFAAITIE